MTITNKAMAKVAVVATGLAMATSMLSLAPIAHAATCTFTVNLTVGSKGADVTCLQQGLIGMGYSIPAGATGFFGAQTKAAVAAWQAKMGISPAVGYFGPISRGKWMNAGGTASGGVSTGCLPGYLFNPVTGAACGTSTGSTGGSTSGSLTGAGRLTNISSGGDTTSDLNEGDPSTAVVGVTADVRGGDVAIQRVDADIYLTESDLTTANGGSSSASKYFSSVELYVNGKKVASMDAAEGDKDGRHWSYRFSNLDTVVRSGNEADIYVHVTPVSSVGIDENGANVQAVIPETGIRVADASGVSDTYGVTGDEQQEFNVSTASNGKLTVSTSSANPDDSTFKVDDSDTTDGVTLLGVSLRAKTQDVTVHDLPIQLCTSDAIGDVVQSVKLMKGSTALKTRSVSGSGTCANVVFDGIDVDLSQDTTTNYTVVATLKSTDNQAAYQDGDTLIASTTNALAWDVEDSNGNAVDGSDLTGGALGGTMTLQTTGISVTKGAVTSTATAHTGAPDTYSATITFTVAASTDDLWIANSTASSSTAQAGKVTWNSKDQATAVLTTPSGAITADGSTSSDTGTAFKVAAGDSRTFTLTVTGEAHSTGLTGIQLVGISYSIGGDTDGTGQLYTSGLDNFVAPANGLTSVHFE